MSLPLADRDTDASELSGMIWVSQPGYLRLSGEDNQAFLQRQTTNDLTLIKPGHALATILTTPTARIQDVLYLLQEQDAIGILTLPNRGQATARYLQNRIFFMDKVSLTDLSPEIALAHIFGPKAIPALTRLGFPSELSIDRVSRVEFAGADLASWLLNPVLSFCAVILAPISSKEKISSILNSNGITSISESEYERIRVERGYPDGDAELIDAYTHLEVGLEGLVSLKKGCYTGQEVLARQVNYEKISQRLMGLQLERPASSGDKLYSEDGRPAGVLTSYAYSPRLGPIGLAVVKRPFFQPGSSLQVKGSEDQPQSALLVPLPFP